MKKIMLSLTLILLSLLFTTNVLAFHITPPENSVEVASIDNYSSDMSLYNGGSLIRPKIISSERNTSENYTKVYKLNKLISVPIHNYTNFIVCNNNQKIKVERSINEADIVSTSYEELVETSIGASLGVKVEEKVGFPLFESTVGVNAEVTASIGTHIAQVYTREKSISKSISVTYEINEPGYYILQQRKLFTAYLFEEYFNIYEINNRHQRLYLYGSYLKNVYIKLVPIDSLDSNGLYKYILNNSEYFIDTTNVLDGDKVLYI